MSRPGVSSPGVYDWGRRLADLKERDLFRAPRVLASAPAARVTVEGRTLVNFASNDYLGLASHPRVAAAARDAIEAWGTGATAARLMAGTLALHAQLESVLAALKKAPACAVFPSGYHANAGALPALCEPGDTIVLDRLSHASLVDGARLSKARLLVFRHNDVEDLERVLRRASVEGRRWIVTESVFSMDGDVAPLCEMAFLARQYNARLYVDEAHGAGVFGPDGAGVVNGLGLEKQVEVAMGTLSKAFGAQGGYAAGGAELVSWLHNRARSFIYSTALNPAAAAAALAAVAVCRDEPERRARVLALAGRLRDGLERLRGGAPRPSPIKSPYSPYERGPIVPWVVGEAGAAVALSRALWEKGFYVPAVRPPTVPAGTARLRFTVTAGHSEEDIDRLLEALAPS